MQSVALHIRTQRLLRAVLLWGMAGLMLLLALAAAAVYFGTPELARFRPELEQSMTRVLGQPVHIGRLQVRWDGGPRIRMRNVRVGDAAQPQIRLPRLDLAFHPLPLLWGRYAVSSLRMDDPYLAMERLPDGRLKVGGKVLGGKGDTLSLTLEHANIQVRNGVLDWRDARHPHIGRVRFSRVNLQVKRGYRQHVEGSIALPPALGDSIQVKGAARHLFSDPLHSWGDATITIRHLHTDYLAGYFTEALPFSIGGTVSGTLRSAWWKGRVTRLDGPVEVSDPTLTYPAYYHTPLRAKSVNLHLNWRTQHEEGRLRLQHIRLRRAGEHWRPFNVTLYNRLSSGPTRLALRVDHMDIGPTLKLLPPKLIPPVWQRYFARAKPQGLVQDFQLAWQEGGPGQPEHFAIYNRFSQVRTSAVDKAPGLSNLSGALTISDRRGALSVNGKDVLIDWPYAFRHRIPVRDLRGQANWHWDAKALLVNIPSFRLRGDLNAEGHARILRRPGQHIDLDLVAQAAHVQAANLPRYYPYRIMSPELLHWLDHAFLKGRVDSAQVRLRGPLDKFPFPNPRDGDFTAGGHVSGVTLRYDPKWPLAEDLSGTVNFARQGMTLRAERGRILDAPISKLRAGISDMMHHKPLLTLRGQVDTSFNTGLIFLRNSPILRNSPLGRADISAEGMSPLDLALKIPLWHGSRPEVDGHVDLRQVDLHWNGWTAHQVSGPLHFTQDEIEAPALDAGFLDGPARVALQVTDLGHDPHIRIDGQGQASPVALKRHFDQRWLTRIAGAIPYRLQVKMHNEDGSYTFDSPLTGVAVQLPPPLAKAPAQALPLQAEGDFTLNKFLRIAARAGKSQAAQFMLAQGDQGWTLAQAAWRIGSPQIPALPAQGWRITGQGDVLPLTAWMTALQGLTAAPGTRPAVPAPAAGPWPPIQIDTRWRQVLALDRVWPDVRIQGRYAGPEQHAAFRLDGPDVAGNLDYVQGKEPQATLRLSRLHVPAAGTAAPGTPAPTPQTPAPDSTPLRVDARIEDLRWDGHQVDHLDFTAERQPARWLIQHLHVRAADTTLDATGTWAGAGQGQTRLRGRMETANLANTLKKLAFNSGLGEGRTQVIGELNWPGWPLGFDARELDGELQLQIKDGRFTGISPVVKILSLANVTSMLQRILTFDFRDFQGKGLFFNELSAGFKLEDGNAYTDSLELQSNAMHIRARGDINLRRHDLNMDLDIQPLQAVDQLVGRFPVLGPALFGQQGAVVSLHYKATGTWQDPHIFPVSRYKEREQP